MANINGHFDEKNQKEIKVSDENIIVLKVAIRAGCVTWMIDFRHPFSS